MTLTKLFLKASKMKRLTVSLLMILFFEFIIGTLKAQQEDLKVIERWMQYSDSPNALYHHLSSQAYEYLDKRTSEVGKIITKEQWIERQKEVHKILMDIVGPFPKLVI